MRIIIQNLSTNTKYSCNFIINYEVQNTNTKYNCNFIINSEVQNSNTKCGPPDAVKAPPVEKCILVLSTPKLQRKEWSLKYKWMDCCLKYFLFFLKCIKYLFSFLLSSKCKCIDWYLTYYLLFQMCQMYTESRSSEQKGNSAKSSQKVSLLLLPEDQQKCF